MMCSLREFTEVLKLEVYCIYDVHAYDGIVKLDS